MIISNNYIKRFDGVYGLCVISVWQQAQSETVPEGFAYLFIKDILCPETIRP